MAEFKGHLESYDSQLHDVKQTVGDAQYDLTQMDEKVELLKRNVTSLKGRLSGLQLQDQDTSNSLELLSAVCFILGLDSQSLCCFMFQIQWYLCTFMMHMCTSFSPQQFSALQIVVREINETVNQEVALTSEELNEVIVYPLFKTCK